MSAMHWEARRRQCSLDNRMARHKLQKDSDTSSNATASNTSNTTQEQTADRSPCYEQSSPPVCNYLVPLLTHKHYTCTQTADGGQCPHCKGDLKTPVHHSAKIPNRYSSLQYNQQW